MALPCLATEVSEATTFVAVTAVPSEKRACGSSSNVQVVPTVAEAPPAVVLDEVGALLVHLVASAGTAALVVGSMEVSPWSSRSTAIMSAWLVGTT